MFIFCDSSRFSPCVCFSNAYAHLSFVKLCIIPPHSSPVFSHFCFNLNDFRTTSEDEKMEPWYCIFHTKYGFHHPVFSFLFCDLIYYNGCTSLQNTLQMFIINKKRISIRVIHVFLFDSLRSIRNLPVIINELVSWRHTMKLSCFKFYTKVQVNVGHFSNVNPSKMGF